MSQPKKVRRNSHASNEEHILTPSSDIQIKQTSSLSRPRSGFENDLQRKILMMQFETEVKDELRKFKQDISDHKKGFATALEELKQDVHKTIEFRK